jgi:hypothetical protein
VQGVEKQLAIVEIVELVSLMVLVLQINTAITTITSSISTTIFSLNHALANTQTTPYCLILKLAVAGCAFLGWTLPRGGQL